MPYQNDCWKGRPDEVVQEGEDTDFETQVKDKNIKTYLLYGAIAFGVYCFFIRKKN